MHDLLLDAGIVIEIADDRLWTGLVHSSNEGEFGPVIRVHLCRNDGPAGQDLGQVGDVILRINSSDAERVELQDLAR